MLITNVSGAGAMVDYLDELLAIRGVIDLAANPDAYRRTIQSKATVSGVLVPLVGAPNLWKLFGVAEAYLQDPNHFNRDLLTGKMRTILDRVREREQVPTDLEYLTFDPQDYTVYHSIEPACRVICLHTRPERAWFLPVLDYGLTFGESLGRMRVYYARLESAKRPLAHPVVIRTKWRALTDQRVIKELKDVWREGPR